MSGKTNLFSSCFVIRPILYPTNYFKTLDVYISVKCGQQVQLRNPRGGPDTHDDPHEMGTSQTAARPRLVQKNQFSNYQKPLNI